MRQVYSEAAAVAHLFGKLVLLCKVPRKRPKDTHVQNLKSDSRPLTGPVPCESQSVSGVNPTRRVLTEERPGFERYKSLRFRQQLRH